MAPLSTSTASSSSSIPSSSISSSSSSISSPSSLPLPSNLLTTRTCGTADALTSSNQNANSYGDENKVESHDTGGNSTLDHQHAIPPDFDDKRRRVQQSVIDMVLLEEPEGKNEDSKPRIEPFEQKLSHGAGSPVKTKLGPLDLFKPPKKVVEFHPSLAKGNVTVTPAKEAVSHSTNSNVAHRGNKEMLRSSLARLERIVADSCQIDSSPSPEPGEDDLSSHLAPSQIHTEEREHDNESNDSEEPCRESSRDLRPGSIPGAFAVTPALARGQSNQSQSGRYRMEIALWTDDGYDQVSESDDDLQAEDRQTNGDEAQHLRDRSTGSTLEEIGDDDEHDGCLVEARAISSEDYDLEIQRRIMESAVDAQDVVVVQPGRKFRPCFCLLFLLATGVILVLTAVAIFVSQSNRSNQPSSQPNNGMKVLEFYTLNVSVVNLTRQQAFNWTTRYLNNSNTSDVSSRTSAFTSTQYYKIPVDPFDSFLQCTSWYDRYHSSTVGMYLRRNSPPDVDNSIYDCQSQKLLGSSLAAVEDPGLTAVACTLALPSVNASTPTDGTGSATDTSSSELFLAILSTGYMGSVQTYCMFSQMLTLGTPSRFFSLGERPIESFKIPYIQSSSKQTSTTTSIRCSLESNDNIQASARMYLDWGAPVDTYTVKARVTEGYLGCSLYGNSLPVTCRVTASAGLAASDETLPSLSPSFLYVTVAPLMSGDSTIKDLLLSCDSVPDIRYMTLETGAPLSVPFVFQGDVLKAYLTIASVEEDIQCQTRAYNSSGSVQLKAAVIDDELSCVSAQPFTPNQICLITPHMTSMSNKSVVVTVTALTDMQNLTIYCNGVRRPSPTQLRNQVPSKPVHVEVGYLHHYRFSTHDMDNFSSFDINCMANVASGFGTLYMRWNEVASTNAAANCSAAVSNSTGSSSCRVQSVNINTDSLYITVYASPVSITGLVVTCSASPIPTAQPFAISLIDGVPSSPIDLPILDTSSYTFSTFFRSYGISCTAASSNTSDSLDLMLDWGDGVALYCALTMCNGTSDCNDFPSCRIGPPSNEAVAESAFVNVSVTNSGDSVAHGVVLTCSSVAFETISLANSSMMLSLIRGARKDFVMEVQWNASEQLECTTDAINGEVQLFMQSRGQLYDYFGSECASMTDSMHQHCFVNPTYSHSIGDTVTLYVTVMSKDSDSNFLLGCRSDPGIKLVSGGSFEDTMRSANDDQIFYMEVGAGADGVRCNSMNRMSMQWDAVPFEDTYACANIFSGDGNPFTSTCAINQYDDMDSRVVHVRVWANSTRGIALTCHYVAAVPLFDGTASSPLTLDASEVQDYSFNSLQPVSQDVACSIAASSSSGGWKLYAQWGQLATSLAWFHQDCTHDEDTSLRTCQFSIPFDNANTLFLAVQAETSMTGLVVNCTATPPIELPTETLFSVHGGGTNMSQTLLALTVNSLQNVVQCQVSRTTTDSSFYFRWNARPDAYDVSEYNDCIPFASTPSTYASCLLDAPGFSAGQNTNTLFILANVGADSAVSVQCLSFSVVLLSPGIPSSFDRQNVDRPLYFSLGASQNMDPAPDDMICTVAVETGGGAILGEDNVRLHLQWDSMVEISQQEYICPWDNVTISNAPNFTCRGQNRPSHRPNFLVVIDLSTSTSVTGTLTCSFTSPVSRY